MDESVAVPNNGRPERDQVLCWVAEELTYVHNKFGTSEDEYRDKDLKDTLDLSAFWEPRIQQYVDRAKVFMNGALEARLSNTPDCLERSRRFEQMAQQQMAKAAMTALDSVCSMVRVFGEMPKPGVSSGIIEVWHPRCEACGNLLDIENEPYHREAGSQRFFHAGECG